MHHLQITKIIFKSHFIAKKLQIKSSNVDMDCNIYPGKD
jgi:hypothetical protein